MNFIRKVLYAQWGQIILKACKYCVCLSEGIVQKAHLIGDPANGLSQCSCVLTAAGLCKLMIEVCCCLFISNPNPWEIQVFLSFRSSGVVGRDKDRQEEIAF